MPVDYLTHDEMYKAARAKGWNGWGGNERMAREHILLERLFSYNGVPKTGAALELGCGEGHYSRRLAEKEYEVTGLDVSQTAIDWAIEKITATKHKISFRVCDLSKPNVLGNQKFDLIVDGNCLHCIIGDDRSVFLDNIYHALSESGIFFVSSLCSSSGIDELIKYKGRPYRTVLSHDNLLAELTTAGFKIMKSVFHEGDKTSHCTAHASKRFN